jgi:hypothetical protein
MQFETSPVLRHWIFRMLRTNAYDQQEVRDFLASALNDFTLKSGQPGDYTAINAKEEVDSPQSISKETQESEIKRLLKRWANHRLRSSQKMVNGPSLNRLNGMFCRQHATFIPLSHKG